MPSLEAAAFIGWSFTVKPVDFNPDRPDGISSLEAVGTHTRVGIKSNKTKLAGARQPGVETSTGRMIEYR